MERPPIHLLRPRSAASPITPAEEVSRAQAISLSQRKGVKITLPAMPPRQSHTKKGGTA